MRAVVRGAFWTGFLALSTLILCVRAGGHQDPPPYPVELARSLQTSQQFYSEPHLLRAAIEAGLWPGDISSGDPEERASTRTSALVEQYFHGCLIHHQANPYYQRGDFDGDGETDLAVTIRLREGWIAGIAVVPATLDTVFVLSSTLYDSYWPRSELVSLRVVESKQAERLLLVFRDGLQLRMDYPDRRFELVAVAPTADPAMEPGLVTAAREAGLWPAELRYEVLTDRNPYCLRGDFDGDGLTDVVVHIRDARQREPGLAVIPARLDTLHILTAGTMGRGPITNAGFIRVITSGTTLVPFAGGPGPPPEPIVLTADAIEASWGGPYSGAFYFRDGRFHWVTLTD